MNRIFFLSKRSAMTPAKIPRVSMGIVRMRFTRTTATVEPVNCHVSQLRARRSACIAVAELTWPNHMKRKSWICSESKAAMKPREVAPTRSGASAGFSGMLRAIYTRPPAASWTNSEETSGAVRAGALSARERRRWICDCTLHPDWGWDSGRDASGGRVGAWKTSHDTGRGGG